MFQKGFGRGIDQMPFSFADGLLQAGGIVDY
jgi:hypothetical protein